MMSEQSIEHSIQKGDWKQKYEVTEIQAFLLMKFTKTHEYFGLWMGLDS